MKERPIIFSGPMVRAILEGRKHQTRRVMRHQPPDDVGRLLVDAYNPTVVRKNGEEEPGPEVFGAFSENGEWGMKCPYGHPGNQLWVRETWATVNPRWRPGTRSKRTAVNYRATDEIGPYLKWRPSLHMPRWASRITLEVTDVRVERLQDISEEDAMAEGVEPHPMHHFCKPSRRLTQAFATLWNSLNAKRGFGWETNPWVWVLSFKRVEAQEVAA